jgi:hypothetical protein
MRKREFLKKTFQYIGANVRQAPSIYTLNRPVLNFNCMCHSATLYLH